MVTDPQTHKHIILYYIIIILYILYYINCIVKKSPFFVQVSLGLLEAYGRDVCEAQLSENKIIHSKTTGVETEPETLGDSWQNLHCYIFTSQFTTPKNYG